MQRSHSSCCSPSSSSFASPAATMVWPCGSPTWSNTCRNRSTPRAPRSSSRRRWSTSPLTSPWRTRSTARGSTSMTSESAAAVHSDPLSTLYLALCLQPEAENRGLVGPPSTMSLPNSVWDNTTWLSGEFLKGFSSSQHRWLSLINNWSYWYVLVVFIAAIVCRILNVQVTWNAHAIFSL